MPFHTFIVNFKGSTYAAQGSYRNCKGFVSAWSGDLPDGAVPGLTPNFEMGVVTESPSRRVRRSAEPEASWRVDALPLIARPLRIEVPVAVCYVAVGRRGINQIIRDCLVLSTGLSVSTSEHHG